MRPVVIAVAITGSVPRKKDNPAVPVTVAEQVESTHAAFDAGATLVHVHVRNPDETSSSDPAVFGQVLDGIRRHCPGMIVQFSTGGRGRDQSARGNPLTLKPDMASLATGSVNFPTMVYENAPALVIELATRMQEHGVAPEIEIFDLAHLHATRRLVDLGLVSDTPHVQFVMGIRNALPVQEHLLDVMLTELRRVLPKATWTAAGIGRHQTEVIDWVLQRQGDAVRTGLEDNIRINRHRLAASNAELVSIAVERCTQHDARPATTAEARAMLHLADVPAVSAPPVSSAAEPTCAT
ncbi:MAG: 3-keto-5-aminohexanoate cleavage protein [Burkholderiaceae bacterium]